MLPYSKLHSIGFPKCINIGKKGPLPALTGKSGCTDYPVRGANLAIRFENSDFALFPLDLAVMLAVTYPKAWCQGGNHFGNYAFEHWYNAVYAMQKGVSIPKDSLRWMKKREQYIARHRRDFRLAGTIAMIKWAGFVDGPQGLGDGSTTGTSLRYMVDLISDYGR